MIKSIWTDSARLPEFKRAKGDAKTDVLIVGGGICGILCAYFLEKNGIDYMLAEGGKIGGGITQNTTAKITSQHSLIYDKIIASYGREKAMMYLKANERAIERYSEISAETDCDFERKSAYTYSLSDEKKIIREVEAVNSLGFNAHFAENLPLPFKTKGAVEFKNQAQLNPLKFISGISKNLNIYENTFIKKISRNTAFYDGGKITAEKFIIAAHFPFINTHGSYFLKMYQHRSYVIAFENAQDVGSMYVDESKEGMSFRNYGDYLLIGGGGHKTGKNGGNWDEIRDFAKKYYPYSQEKYRWAAQDCMSLDGIPYIGHYSKHTPNMYVATGFNKWGFTTSMAAADILCDMIMGRDNEFREVFSPHRSIVKPRLFVNGLNAVVNLMTPSLRRCPHMGCALKWNKAERSWDCPCHGSRFDENGNLTGNPSMKDANVKKQ